MELNQVIVNWLLAGFGGLFGFLLNSLWGAVKDLQIADRELADKVGGIEVLVAGAYVKRDELHGVMHSLFAKLDKIEDKLNSHLNK